MIGSNRFLDAAAAVASALLALVASPTIAGCSADPSSAGSGGSGAGTSSTGGADGGSVSVGGTAGSAGSGGQGVAGAGGADICPPKPAGLVGYLSGADGDADHEPSGPAVVLMGGSTDVDGAFEWWKTYTAGGDLVVLRTSGADGYNDYLYSEIGGCDSVETLLVTSRAWADHEYVAWRIRHAEGIFIAGGNQATYLANWKGTALEDSLRAAYARGAAIGGTSAGCAVLGAFVFSASNGTVYSTEALDNPYNPYMTLEQDFLELPLLAGVVTDSHFAARDRMGRLVAFMARVVQDGWSTDAIGVGVDECTALVIGPTGVGEVLTQSACGGQGGAVYVVHSTQPPASCQAGQPLQYSGLEVYELTPGASVTFPGAITSAASSALSASGGALSPADPY